MLAIERNFFGFGADETPVTAPVAVSTLPTEKDITLPVIPDDTVVRCKFDPTIKSFRCSPVGLFEAPTVFLLAAAGLAILGLGYAFGSTRFIPRAVESFTAEPRLPTRHR